MRAPLSAPRLRWSAPRFERVGNEIIRTTIRRLGKSCGAAVDALEKVGGSATVVELADLLEVKRPRDLRRRVISRLEEAGVVECSGETVDLAANWLEALDRDRERGGELAAFRRDIAAYNREREGYRNRHKNKPDRAPSWGEMEADRRARHDCRVEKALEAFKTSGSGAQINLRLARDGELHRTEYIVKSVLAYHGVTVDQWQEWESAVLEAGRETVVAEVYQPLVGLAR